MPDREGPAVGRVAGLFRYPVKSMGGEALERARVRFSGVEGDRRYAFLRADGGRAVQLDFPWFTGREYPSLVTYRARALDAAAAKVSVITPAGLVLDVESEALRAELESASGRAVTLLRLGRGTYDGSPLSLIGTRTVEATALAAGLSNADARRYRPNLLIDLYDGAHEDEWIGRSLVIGDSVRLYVTRLDPRCMMINLDPDTGRQNPQVLRYVAGTRGNNLGVYATVLSEGMLHTGDEIRLIPIE